MKVNPDRPSPRVSYQNMVLTGILALLGLGLMERSGLIGSVTEPAGAFAQSWEQPEAGGLLNALEQRKMMLAELRVMNSRLERIESRLAGRLEVRVTEMPPLRLPAEPKPRPADRGAAPAEGQKP